jgi:hypothetical protein
MAPVRGSQAPAFPSIVRVSLHNALVQDEPPWHWGHFRQIFRDYNLLSDSAPIHSHSIIQDEPPWHRGDFSQIFCD